MISSVSLMLLSENYWKIIKKKLHVRWLINDLDWTLDMLEISPAR